MLELNKRQDAVDSARGDMEGHTKSEVYHYTEVNRVRDAIDSHRMRLVGVLDKTDVDCVSYSSHDVKVTNDQTTKATIKYIESKMKPKPSIKFPRVFIGEFCISARLAGDDPAQHDRRNCERLITFLESGVPYILYWQMYSNELTEDRSRQEGVWLIDDNEDEWPFYRTLQALYKAQKTFTDARQGSIDWLKHHLSMMQ